LRVGVCFEGGSRSVAQHDQGKDGEPDRHHRRDGRAELHSVDKGFASGLENGGAELVGKLPSDGHGATEGVTGECCRLGGDVWREATRQLATVDRDADAAQYRDAQRAA